MRRLFVVGMYIVMLLGRIAGESVRLSVLAGKAVPRLFVQAGSSMIMPTFGYRLFFGGNMNATTTL